MKFTRIMMIMLILCASTFNSGKAVLNAQSNLTDAGVRTCTLHSSTGMNYECDPLTGLYIFETIETVDADQNPITIKLEKYYDRETFLAGERFAVVQDAELLDNLPSDSYTHGGMPFEINNVGDSFPQKSMAWEYMRIYHGGWNTTYESRVTNNISDTQGAGCSVGLLFNLSTLECEDKNNVSQNQIASHAYMSTRFRKSKEGATQANGKDTYVSVFNAPNNKDQESYNINFALNWTTGKDYDVFTVPVTVEPNPGYESLLIEKKATLTHDDKILSNGDVFSASTKFENRGKAKGEVIVQDLFTDTELNDATIEDIYIEKNGIKTYYTREELEEGILVDLDVNEIAYLNMTITLSEFDNYYDNLIQYNTLFYPQGEGSCITACNAYAEVEGLWNTDVDGDGIADVDDLCPSVSPASDVNRDGCEDKDNSPVEIADTDGDGINDVLDNCPDLVPTIDLDVDGCEDKDNSPIEIADTDGDGINDVLDNCPEVAPTIDVDVDGCEDKDNSPIEIADTDGDGVNDVLDNCPEIAPTIDVDVDGCEDKDNSPIEIADTDGDGVNDVLDNCPNSVPTIDVDLDGCEDKDNSPIEIADTDGDGVNDILDNCPNSVPTIDVDLDGCEDKDNGPIEIADTDGDEINDVLDNCPEVAATLDEDLDGCEDITEDPEQTLDIDNDTVSKEEASLVNSGISQVTALMVMMVLSFAALLVKKVK